MAEELRVGIAGLRRGKDFLPGLTACAQARVTALCDTDPAQLERYAAGAPEARWFGDYREMLDSGTVDLVVVATPIQLHAPMCVEALDRGLHTLSEVSAAISLEQCRDLVAAVRRSSAKYMMAENCCYMKPYVLVREMARAGVFGEVYYGEGDYIHEIRLSHGTGHWRDRWLFGRRGGTYITHPLGPVLEWMDDRVVTVNCQGGGVHADPRLRMDDMTVMLCRTARGGLIMLRNDMLSPRPHTHNFVALQGTRGCYEAARHPEDGHRVCLVNPEATREERRWQSLWDFEDEFLPEWWKHPADETMDAGHGGSDYFPVRAFVDAILNDTDPPIDVYRALDYTVPGLMSEVSIEQGGVPVAVPDFRIR